MISIMRIDQYLRLFYDKVYHQFLISIIIPELNGVTILLNNDY